MSTLASAGVATSAFVIFALGAVHLVLTFVGDKLRPRDVALESALEAGFLRITTETTMWNAWVGFNASHSLGAMLFGLVYGYLALAQPWVLFGSVFLLAVGQLILAGYAVLGVRYWFSVPRAGIWIANAAYAGALIARWS
jgi:hypothetical protein